RSRSSAPFAFIASRMKTRARGLLQTLASIALLSSCAFAAVGAWRVGGARLLAKYAGYSLGVETAREAVRMSAEDPETHSAPGAGRSHTSAAASWLESRQA